MKGYLRQDDSCHWYFIPEGKIHEFDRLNNDVCNSLASNSCSDSSYELVDEFVSKFEEYRISNPFDLKFEKCLQ